MPWRTPELLGWRMYTVSPFFNWSIAWRDPAVDVSRAAWPLTIRSLFFIKSSSNQFVFPDMKLAANSYTPFSGAVNTPVFTLKPFLIFVSAVSNFTITFDPNCKWLPFNVTKNAGLGFDASCFSSTEKKNHLSIDLCYHYVRVDLAEKVTQYSEFTSP